MHSASQMTWHHKNQTSSGTMRHPSDGEAWKHFDRTHHVLPQNLEILGLDYALMVFPHMCKRRKVRILVGQLL